jgi:hypothetical protein
MKSPVLFSGIILLGVISGGCTQESAPSPAPAPERTIKENNWPTKTYYCQADDSINEIIDRCKTDGYDGHKIVIDKPISTGPIELISNLTLQFTAKGKLIAKPDLFRPHPQKLFRGDCLIRGYRVRNIKIIGPGILRMRKTEYAGPNCGRHGISLEDCVNVEIGGISPDAPLIIDQTGGDGICIWGWNGCRDVYVRNILCYRAKRNGISICNVDGLFGENIIIRRSEGANPQAGLCIEPEENGHIRRVQIKNLQCLGNVGAGLQIGLNKMRPEEEYHIEIDGYQADENTREITLSGFHPVAGPKGTLVIKKN